eukprot:UN00191
MWFLLFLTYWTLSVAVEPEPLIETLPNYSFYTPAFYNHRSCYVYGARSTGIAWCGRPVWAGEDQYIRVDLLEEYKIHSVSTWPRKDLPSQYVKTYRLSYSMDGETFTDYPKIFIGNTKAVASQEINNILNPNIIARYLRFTPMATNNAGKSMRIEAYGNRDYDYGSGASAMSAIPDIDDGVEINEKNWLDNYYRDSLIVLSLMLNVLMIGYVSCTAGKKKKYGFKKVDSLDDENA